jgi:hypothetical protein
MPGELGNEMESKDVGLYEHRYRANGDDAPIDPDAQGPIPSTKMIVNVLKLVRNQDPESVKF